jgi:DNA-binding CsgD family transcriptional regulator
MDQRERYLACWCQWLCSVGLPTEHIAVVLGTDTDSVPKAIRAIHAAPALPHLKYQPRQHSRQILGHTAIKVDRLAALGYTPARIGQILQLAPQTVKSWLKRTTGVNGTRLAKPRPIQAQARIEANRLRRVKAKAAAAERAIWQRSNSLHDDRGDALPPTPPAAELLDQVEGIEPKADAPMEPNRWHQTTIERGLSGETNPRSKLTWADVDEIRRSAREGTSAYALAKARRLSAGTVRAILKGETWKESDRPSEAVPPCATDLAAAIPAEMPCAGPRAERPKRWRRRKGEALMWATGSGSQYDDEPRPCPAPLGTPPLIRTKHFKTSEKPAANRPPA